MPKTMEHRYDTLFPMLFAHQVLCSRDARSLTQARALIFEPVDHAKTFENLYEQASRSMVLMDTFILLLRSLSQFKSSLTTDC